MRHSLYVQDVDTGEKLLEPYSYDQDLLGAINVDDRYLVYHKDRYRVVRASRVCWNTKIHGHGLWILAIVNIVAGVPRDFLTEKLVKEAPWEVHVHSYGKREPIMQVDLQAAEYSTVGVKFESTGSYKTYHYLYPNKLGNIKPDDWVVVKVGSNSWPRAVKVSEVYYNAKTSNATKAIIGVVRTPADVVTPDAYASKVIANTAAIWEAEIEHRRAEAHLQSAREGYTKAAEDVDKAARAYDVSRDKLKALKNEWR